MVAVGMGDQDMGHGLAPNGVKQRRRMRFIVGTGIDDRDLALADDVTHRPREGEGARIVAENSPHARTDFIDDAGLERWAERLVPFLEAGDDAYVFFRHDAVGRAAELALDFQARVAAKR